MHCSVRPEVVVKEILEPHSRDEQEVPPVLTPLHHVVNRPLRTDLAIVPARSIEVLVELLKQVHKLEVLRRLERIVVLHQTKRHAKHRPEFRAGRIVHFSDIFSKLIAL
jgi:hypothetical protein